MLPPVVRCYILAKVHGKQEKAVKSVRVCGSLFGQEEGRVSRASLKAAPFMFLGIVEEFRNIRGCRIQGFWFFSSSGMRVYGFLYLGKEVSVLSTTQQTK